MNSLVKDAKPTETLAERSLRVAQAIKAFMENIGFVNKLEQLFRDATFNSQTLKPAPLQPIEIKEVKKEVPVKQEAPKEVPKEAPKEVDKPVEKVV